MFAIILSLIFHLCASFFLKSGALSMTEYTLISVLTNYYYWTSIFFLFLQAIAWQIALKNFSLNYAYMFNSLYYPMVLLLSYFVFSEYISFANLFGTMLIIVGLILSKKV